MSFLVSTPNEIQGRIFTILGDLERLNPYACVYFSFYLIVVPVVKVRIDRWNHTLNLLKKYKYIKYKYIRYIIITAHGSVNFN